MFRRRQALSPELRDALRSAERAARGVSRRGRWRRRAAMLLPGALLPSLLIILAFVLLRDRWADYSLPAGPHRIEMPAALPTPPTAAAPRTGSAAMPRVIYGGSTAVPATQTAGTITLRAAVVDGDTVASGGERLRLNGIDAPEMGQLCERPGGGYHCGEQARAALHRILGGGALTCEVIGVDRYQRRVVRCANAAGEDIAAAMVLAGWAMAYRRYSVDYVPQEDEARAHGRGIWAGRFEPPWDWRRRQGY